MTDSLPFARKKILDFRMYSGVIYILMKRLFALSALFLFAVCFSAQAELRIPSSVFTMEELEEAKAEAREEKEPLIFLYTDPAST